MGCCALIRWYIYLCSRRL